NPPARYTVHFICRNSKLRDHWCFSNTGRVRVIQCRLPCKNFPHFMGVREKWLSYYHFQKITFPSEIFFVKYRVISFLNSLLVHGMTSRKPRKSVKKPGAIKSAPAMIIQIPSNICSFGTSPL